MKALELKIFVFSVFFFFIFVNVFENFIYLNFYNQLIIFSLPLIWPGLAHGSLDVLTAERFNLIKSKKTFFFFITIYICIPISFFFFWLKFPNVLFVLFLILSGLHFGISDRESKLSIQRKLEVLLRALIIIFLPIKFYIYEIKEIFMFFIVSENLISLLFHWSEFFLYLTIFIFLFFLISFVFKKISVNLFIEFTLLLFCFIYFKPLVSFFIYFCFLHSIRHLLHEKFKLNLSFKNLFIRTLPMTTLSCLFICVLIFTVTQIDIFDLNHIIVALSSLTVSHIFLINFLKSD